MSKYTEDDLLNLITQAEYNAITQYRKDYNNAEHGHFLGSRELLRPWATAKAASLIDLFGGKLILEKEIVTNALSPREKRKKVKESQAINDFVNTVKEKARELKYTNRITFCDSTNFEQFLDNIELTPTEIYDNKINYNIIFDFIIYKDINHTEKQGHYKKTFLAGTKTTKVFKYISEILSINELYEKFRIAQSMLHNFKNKVTLCLSIHPLDYMTMSDNTYGWSSCMSWEDSGCYRAGTVEMMNSKVVIIAYAKGNNEFYIRDCEWNNKKWRELFVVDFTKEGLISEIKPYPYINEDYTEYILNWIEELGKKNNSITENMTNIVFNKSGADSITLTTTTNLMYNDVSHNSNFKGKLISLPTKSIYKISNFSGACQCMQCGEVDTCENENALTCPDCGGGLYYCDCCDYRSSDEDYFYWVDEQRICRDCLDDNYTWSDLEDKYIPNDYVVTLIIQDDGDREEIFDEYTIFHEEDIYEDNIFHWVKIPEEYSDTYKGIRNFCNDRMIDRGIAIYLDELTNKGLNMIFGCKQNLEDRLGRTKNYEGAIFTIREERYNSRSNNTYVWNGRELIEK